MRLLANRYIRPRRVWKRVIIGPSLASISLGVAPPAIAQHIFGSTDPRSAVITPQVGTDELTQARVALFAFAQCVQHLYPGYVRQFLDTEAGSTEESKQANRLATSECLEGGDLKFSTSLMRGALYEVLLSGTRRSFAMTSDEQIKTAAPIVYGSTSENGGSLRTIMLQFADCAVRADPGDVRKLMKSTAGSREESVSFRLLSPALGGCLPANQKVGMQKIVVRGYLAEAAYKLAAAVPQTLAVKN